MSEAQARKKFEELLEAVARTRQVRCSDQTKKEYEKEKEESYSSVVRLKKEFIDFIIFF